MLGNPSPVGQLILTGVPGAELDLKTARAFKHLQPGGYIFFGRNIKTPEQLRKLLDDLRDLSREEPILTIDQEGGRVSRLKILGNEPPNAAQIGAKNNPNLARKHGEITARLLRVFGFNLNLCPVLDIAFDEKADNSLRGRCYGATVEEVIRLAGAFNDALRSGGILSCGKHFPGYSRCTVDPHHELPTVTLSRSELKAAELAVFRSFSIGQSRVDAMMIGHAFYPALASERRPSSLSRSIVSTLLRDALGFSGLAITDDLDMGAVLNEFGFEETISSALTAGNDMVMICHRIEMASRAAAVLEQAQVTDLDRALEHIASFKAKLAPVQPFDYQEFEVADRDVWDLRVEVLGEARAAERSPEDGKRSPVELF